ncbi:MAG: AMP-binding protein [Actinomycetota bacterium]
MGEVNLGSSWELVADRHGDRPALFHGDVTRTWSEFEARAARLAGGFADAGVGPGDNVACALYNGNEYLEAELAAFKLRAAPCNVNYRYVEEELAYLVDNSDAKVVMFDGALAERFDAVRNRLDGVRLWVHVGDEPTPGWAVGHEDLIAASVPAPRMTRSGEDLWILYTGGTTGNPKGVMWPHEHLVELVGRTLEPLGIEVPRTLDEVAAVHDAIEAAGAVPRQLAAAPLMHGTAGIGALFTLFVGGAVVTLTGRKLDADELWGTVQRTDTTLISIVGDVFARPMVEALDAAVEAGRPYDLSSLRNVTSSGVMWSREIKDRLLAHASTAGADLVLMDSLGASEGVGFGAKQSTIDGDTETATFALGPNAAVFTPEGQRVEPGAEEPGLLAVSGPIPIGYHGDPVKTAETFRELEGRRWSMPGDWARVAADGTLILLGRGSVSINTGGEKVYPEEVEEALKRQPEVVDANVVGVPDATWGSAVTGVVQLAADAEITDEQLVESLRTHLAGYKLPKHIVRVEELFRSPNGKSDYRWATATARDALGV